MKGKLNLKGKDSKKKKIEIGIEKYFKKKIKILCIDLKHFKVNLSSINNNQQDRPKLRKKKILKILLLLKKILSIAII